MAGEQVSYRFGDFLLDPRDKQLLCAGNPVPLKSKAFQTLLLLIENRGHLLSKDEFLKRLWPGTFVEEVVLAQNISQLRKALAANGGEAFIETVPRHGYRFVAAVEIVAKHDDATSPAVVAVLPFENLGGLPEQEYLADGLTEEVIASLGQVDPARVQVIGRTSVMAYKRSAKSLAEIGHALAAAFLLESSMRTESGRIRVTAKLIRAKDQLQIWASSFDAAPTSMLTFQRELSRALAEQIRLRLSPERLDALNKRQTANAEAYDALKFWLDWDWKAAESALRHAIRLDASYRLAHRMLGILLARREDAEARARMERARSLDPLDAMHHALSAQVGLRCARFPERAGTCAPVEHYPARFLDWLLPGGASGFTGTCSGSKKP